MSGAAALQRDSQVLTFLDHHLVTTAGWTRIGCGGGTASGIYSWGAAKVFPASLSTTLLTGAWAVYENASGGQVLFRIANPGIFYMNWSGADQYAVGASDEDTLPTLPADNLAFTGSDLSSVANAKFQFTYTSDHNSFMVFGKRAPEADIAVAVVKLEDYKIGDPRPYWTYYNVAYSATTHWAVSDLSVSPVSGNSRGYHPTTGVQTYAVSEVRFGNASAMTNQPIDPVSGNYQKVELLCGCVTAGSIHIRGKIPGFYRVSDALGTGDRLSLSGGVYEQVVLYDYAVPWMSAEALEF
jgi:hypothetical protein